MNVLIETLSEYDYIAVLTYKGERAFFNKNMIRMNEVNKRSLIAWVTDTMYFKQDYSDTNPLANAFKLIE